MGTAAAARRAPTLGMLRSALACPLESAAADASWEGAAPRRRASVLVPIYGDPPFVIMTAKPRHMRIHAGEISFPGGKAEEGDASPLHTALRETEEEIGLRLGRDRVVGRLDAVTTLTTGFVIAPFVAIMDGRPELCPNLPEVERILRIPFGELLDTMAPDTDPEHNAVQGMYTFEHGGNVVWGASARILGQIRGALLAGCGRTSDG